MTLEQFAVGKRLCTASNASEAHHSGYRNFGRARIEVGQIQNSVKFAEMGRFFPFPGASRFIPA